MIKQFFLNLSIPGWIFFVLFWILILISVFYYRKNLPPLSLSRNIFLTSIRSIILILVFFLILHPVIQFIMKNEELPTVAVLIDNSGSMLIKDYNSTRKDSVEYILKNNPLNAHSDSVNVIYYLFDRSVKNKMNNDPDFSGQQTNISNALEQVNDSLFQENLQSIILISDGIYNEGANPLRFAQKSLVPIHTVLIGDSITGKDLKISGVRVNRVSYAGDTIPVIVNVSQVGYKDDNAYVRLYKGNNQILVKNIQLPVSGFEKQVEFEIKLDKPGDYQYKAEIEVRETDIIKGNNFTSFWIRVLKNKNKVLLISGQPSFDQKILIHSLNEIPEIEYSKFTERLDGHFYEGNIRSEILDSIDVFIFLGYPNNRSNSLILNKILGIIRDLNRPIFLFITHKTSIPYLDSIKDILPFDIQSKIIMQKNVIPFLTEQGKTHPTLLIEENPQLNLILWTDLPPVNSLGRNLILNQSVQLLLAERSDKKQNIYPVLFASTEKNVKSLVLSAENFYGWHMQLQNDPSKDRLFIKFMEKSILWLVNKEDLEKILIRPSKRVFKTGETVYFSGEVLDDFYQNVTHAEARIDVKGEGYELSNIMEEKNGYFDCQLSGLPPGVYKYQITIDKNSRKIGTKAGKFIIENLELELQETRANVNLMEKIARLSGGEFYRPLAFTKEYGIVELKKQIRYSKIEYIIWNKIYWLGIIIMALFLEWFFRKKWGLL